MVLWHQIIIYCQIRQSSLVFGLWAEACWAGLGGHTSPAIFRCTSISFCANSHLSMTYSRNTFNTIIIIPKSVSSQAHQTIQKIYAEVCPWLGTQCISRTRSDSRGLGLPGLVVDHKLHQPICSFYVATFLSIWADADQRTLNKSYPLNIQGYISVWHSDCL